MACCALRQAAGLRDGPDPLAGRRRRLLVHAARRRSLPEGRLPDRSSITTVQPGAAPEQIETEVTDKIEEAVNTISGIDELRSISSEGISQVIVSFLLEKDTDVAAQEVRDKVNGVLPLLPRTIQQPRVEKLDPDAAPVLSIALTRQQADPRHHRIRRQGAAAAARERRRRRPGARPRRPPAADQRLARRRSAARLQPDGHRRRRARCRRRTSRSPAAASIRAPQSVTLRTRGRVQTVAEFGDIVVREKDGHPVRVRDVARVEDGEADADTVANVERQRRRCCCRSAGSRAPTPSRSSTAVKERLEELEPTLPPGYDAAHRPRPRRSSSRRRSTASRST